jgi:hypothetical protein
VRSVLGHTISEPDVEYRAEQNRHHLLCCSVNFKKAVSPLCVQFWDTRSPNPMLSIELPERAYCADVDFPMAVVGTAGRGIIIYQLDGQPKEFKKVPVPRSYVIRKLVEKF